MIDKDGSTYRVTLPMVIANARALLHAGRAFLGADTERDVQLDLEAVREVDSSALAVLFGLQRSARERDKALRVKNPPASLLSLAGLYGVADLPPFA
ncbi:MAG: STAS domain-containing protein [Candidatus Accumulibacter sp.]|jgi:phospholipid transport system transporter-binding protein|nr:STAS domain-containing protein [Accumulibacter sp.]